jgi:hypothetical protein
VKHRHDMQGMSKEDVSKTVLSKIANPLTVIRLTVLHDDAGERLWGTMLATYCVYIELFCRTSHKLINQDSSHSYITTMGDGGVGCGGGGRGGEGAGW